MRLADKIQEWLDEQEWTDEQLRDDENSSSRVSTGYLIDGQSYRLFIESDENRDWIKVFLYAPIRTKENKRQEMCELLNRINLSSVCGKIYITPDGTICVQSAIDVEGADPSVNMISNLVSGCVGFYDNWFEELSSVALTKATAKEIFDALDTGSDEEETPDSI
jgi:hypothetical protein